MRSLEGRIVYVEVLISVHGQGILQFISVLMCVYVFVHVCVVYHCV